MNSCPIRCPSVMPLKARLAAFGLFAAAAGEADPPSDPIRQAPASPSTASVARQEPERAWPGRQLNIATPQGRWILGPIWI
jgi:hypothetical protein